MAGHIMTPGRSRAERERLRRTLTFWLRPAFVLRVLNRFQRVVGFDRAIALASSAFTALIPLAIIAGAILPQVDASDAAHTIVARYGLTGAGAKAVEDVLSPPGGTSTSVGVLGLFLLVLAVLSFTRGTQRLFEQTWELEPLSVRNTVNDLVWIAVLVCFIAFSWWIRSLLDGGHVQVVATLVLILPSAVFLAWSGRVLTARRIGWRTLLPFAIIGAGLLALYSIGAGVYLPHLFNSYASRYGTVGAVLAMISALFALMLVVVVSAAIGREVSEELDRIGRGERPPDDEVSREWHAVIEQARSRTETVRTRIDRVRHRDRQPG
jgi:uncharacterized BrkB/YihY/UPF0761 family membrane protein